MERKKIVAVRMSEKNFEKLDYLARAHLRSKSSMAYKILRDHLNQVIVGEKDAK